MANISILHHDNVYMRILCNDNKVFKLIKNNYTFSINTFKKGHGKKEICLLRRNKYLPRGLIKPAAESWTWS